MPPMAEIQEDVDEDQNLEEVCAAFGLVGVKIKASDLANEINWRREQKRREAMRIQLLAAKVQGERKLMRDDKRSSIGETTLQMHPFFRSEIQRIYGREALNDDTFVRELKRDHPMFKVTSKNDRLTIVRPEFGTKHRRRGPVGKRGRWAA
jgi:hypothetical protein